MKKNKIILYVNIASLIILIVKYFEHPIVEFLAICLFGLSGLYFIVKAIRYAFMSKK